MPADQQRTDTDTVKVDLGGREVAVPKGACTTGTGCGPTSTRSPVTRASAGWTSFVRCPRPRSTPRSAPP